MPEKLLQKKKKLLYMKKLLLALTCCTSLTATAQDPYLKFVNNIADQNMSGVDVYMGNTMMFDNLHFRETTQFMVGFQGPSGITVGVAPMNSTNSNDVIATATVLPTGQDTIIVVFNGVFSTTGYSPLQPVRVDMYPNIHLAASDPTKTDVIFATGSTDAPVTDVRSGITTWSNNLALGNASPYVTLPANRDTIFRMTNSTGYKVKETYSLPLSTNAWAGKSIMLLASGFVNPAANSNGQPYEILVVQMDVDGTMLPLPTATAESYARLQLIHNSGDASIARVDMYVNNENRADDLEYLHCTEFLDVWAGQSYNVGVALSNSSSASNSFYSTPVNFTTGKSYVMITNGIKSSTGYYPPLPFAVHKLDDAKEEAGFSTGQNTDYIFHHGSTDAPGIDIKKPNTSILADDLDFGEFSSNYTQFTGTSSLIVTDQGNTDTIKTFDALPTPVNILADMSCVVLTSGFINPASNSNGRPFGMHAAPSTGGALVPLVVIPETPGHAGNMQLDGKSISFWPNPASNTLNIKTNATLSGATAAIYNIAGQSVKLTQNIEGKAIDVSGLVNGVYYISIQKGSEKTGFATFIKQ